MPTKTTHEVACYLTAKISKEGDWYVAETVGLPVVTQGQTSSEAIANIIEATNLFIITCIEKGTLDRVLRKYRWRPSFVPLKTVPRGSVSLPVFLPGFMKRRLEECRV
jgi:predicted RNase H-like HicB family nuclease